MDEILIEEKKYVSSKQAAKITGYAKDYIGQLCREGRVPARLVGRSWYVLETAIRDHRFGDRVIEPVAETEERAPSSLQSTWEPPRYESSPVEVLTFRNRQQEQEAATPVTDQEETKDADGSTQHLQDVWQEFFNHAEETRQEAPAVIPESREQSVEEPEGWQQEATENEGNEIEEEEVNIPIHAIHHRLPEESRPLRIVEEPPRAVRSEPPVWQERRKEKKEIGQRAVKTIRVIGILLAAIAAATALLGSGYFDENVISDSTASSISGISVYNK